MSQSEPAGSAPEFVSRRSLRAARDTESAQTTVSVLRRVAARSVVRPVSARALRTTARRRSPLTSAVAFLAIPGLLLTLALPAYAYAPGAVSTREVARGGNQGLAVSAASVSINLTRDGYTATTVEDIAAQTEASRLASVRERSATAVRASAAQNVSSGIRAENDDYPWPSGVANCSRNSA